MPILCEPATSSGRLLYTIGGDVRAGDDAALAAACRRSYEVSRRMVTDAPTAPETGRHGQIVTVFAAKGGCGKTTLATNLGVVLAMGTGHRVCIVDLDLAFGDVA